MNLLEASRLSASMVIPEGGRERIAAREAEMIAQGVDPRDAYDRALFEEVLEATPEEIEKDLEKLRSYEW